jgi:hypothetical protein
MLIDRLFVAAFEHWPRALTVARAAFACAFLLVAFTLALEIVEVFLPLERISGLLRRPSAGDQATAGSID